MNSSKGFRVVYGVSDCRIQTVGDNHVAIFLEEEEAKTHCGILNSQYSAIGTHQVSRMLIIRGRAI